MWLGDPVTSLAVIPVNGDPIIATRKLRKSLRDVRDRAAHHRRHWRSVAMAGMVSGTHLLLLIQHANIDRRTVQSVMARRWPGVVLGDINDTEPSARLTVEDAVALARRRRGIEPVRIVIAAQVTMSTLRACWDEPMPVAF